jgi:hypothetical protein
MLRGESCRPGREVLRLAGNSAQARTDLEQARTLITREGSQKPFNKYVKSLAVDLLKYGEVDAEQKWARLSADEELQSNEEAFWSAVHFVRRVLDKSELPASVAS